MAIHRMRTSVGLLVAFQMAAKHPRAFLMQVDTPNTEVSLRDSEFRASIEPLFSEKGFELLSILPEGWMVWTTQHAVRTPTDFEGGKIRTMTFPLLLAAYGAYGASPQAMPYGEVYSALQLNMIDAQVNPVFAIEEMSFYEVTDYMIFAQPAPFLATVLTNAAFLAGLEKSSRVLVAEVIEELEPYMFKEQKRTNEERLKKVVEKNPCMILLGLNEEERAEFRERSAKVRERYVDIAGARGRDVLSKLLAAVEQAESDLAGKELDSKLGNKQ